MYIHAGTDISIILHRGKKNPYLEFSRLFLETSEQQQLEAWNSLRNFVLFTIWLVFFYCVKQSK